MTVVIIAIVIITIVLACTKDGQPARPGVVMPGAVVPAGYNGVPAGVGSML